MRRFHVTASARIVSMSMGLGFALSLPACGGAATSGDEDGEISTQSAEIKGGLVTPAKGSVKIDVWFPAFGAWSMCSGTVTSRRTVLTAAHCVTSPLNGATKGNVTVRISRENASKTFDQVLPQTTVVAQINPAYNGSAKNDVAILTASTNLQNVVQADVVPTGKDTPSGGTTNWWAMGYGYSDFTTTDGQGRIAQVSVSFTGTDYVYSVTTGAWMCSGDSGGALKRQTSTATTLYGVYSQGSGPSSGQCSSTAHWAPTGLNMPWIRDAIGAGNCTETSTTLTCW